MQLYPTILSVSDRISCYKQAIINIKEYPNIPYVGSLLKELVSKMEREALSVLWYSQTRWLSDKQLVKIFPELKGQLIILDSDKVTKSMNKLRINILNNCILKLK